MAYCLLRIAKARSRPEWGGMVYAEGNVLGSVGPCASHAEIEAKARILWPTVETEPENGLRADGEPLTGYADLDLDNVHPGCEYQSL